MGHLYLFCLVFLMLLCLFIAALWSPAGKGLTSRLLLVMFIVFLLLSHVVSWVRCGIDSWSLPLSYLKCFKNPLDASCRFLSLPRTQYLIFQL